MLSSQLAKLINPNGYSKMITSISISIITSVQNRRGKLRKMLTREKINAQQ